MCKLVSTCQNVMRRNILSKRVQIISWYATFSKEQDDNWAVFKILSSVFTLIIGSPPLQPIPLSSNKDHASSQRGLFSVKQQSKERRCIVSDRSQYTLHMNEFQGSSKTAVSPVHQQWRYCSFAQSNRNHPSQRVHLRREWNICENCAICAKLPVAFFLVAIWN